MKALIDTNIAVDFLIQREPFYDSSAQIIMLCKNKKINGYIAAHSLTNMFFILRKYFSAADRRSYLGLLCGFLKIVSVGEKEIKSSLNNSNFTDFEDCVQAECAEAAGADYIITRNTKDFPYSVIPAITPEEFLEKSGAIGYNI